MNDASSRHSLYGVAEFGQHNLVAPLKARHELFPLWPERLVLDRFLYHLYAAVLLHPFLVRLEPVIKVRLEYVTYFCHVVVRCHDNNCKDKSFILPAIIL